MRLVDVYPDHEAKAALLFDLLAEREAHQSISHRQMPTWHEHLEFVARQPYLAWYVIEDAGDWVGACYLTRSGEIGIGILLAHQRRGLAKAAIAELMLLWPRPEYLANINPHNLVSLKLFASLGFKGPIQVTLRKENA